jgi:hypothetical protein
MTKRAFMGIRRRPTLRSVSSLPSGSNLTSLSPQFGPEFLLVEEEDPRNEP